jgi:hypothetical protein
VHQVRADDVAPKPNSSRKSAREKLETGRHGLAATASHRGRGGQLLADQRPRAVAHDGHRDADQPTDQPIASSVRRARLRKAISRWSSAIWMLPSAVSTNVSESTLQEGARRGSPSSVAIGPASSMPATVSTRPERSEPRRRCRSGSRHRPALDERVAQALVDEELGEADEDRRQRHQAELDIGHEQPGNDDEDEQAEQLPAPVIGDRPDQPARSTRPLQILIVGAVLGGQPW